MTKVGSDCPVCARVSQLLACSVGGSVHFAIEPEVSQVDVRFAKRDEAGEMSRILTDLHPVDAEGCFAHKRPLPALAASPPKVENVREELRDAFMQVQRAKRGDGPIAMEPIWRIINAVPSALALLDDMDGFERDLAAEALAASPPKGEKNCNDCLSDGTCTMNCSSKRPDQKQVAW